MSKTRTDAAEKVKSSFLPAERSAESAAVHGARCIAVMLEERTRARLPLDAGQEALEHVVRATNLALEAHRHFSDAHRLLATLSEQIGVTTAYGPDDCPPNKPLAEATFITELRVVA